MAFSLILKNVARYIDLTQEESEFFTSLLEPRLLERKKVYLRAGGVCNYSAFVVNGALKSYTVDAQGKEHILSFATRDWWIADLYSLLSRKPAVLNIEAIEEDRKSTRLNSSHVKSSYA